MSKTRLLMVPCILLFLALPAAMAFGAQLDTQAGVQPGTVPAAPFTPAKTPRPAWRRRSCNHERSP